MVNACKHRCNIVVTYGYDMASRFSCQTIFFPLAHDALVYARLIKAVTVSDTGNS